MEGKEFRLEGGGWRERVKLETGGWRVEDGE